MFLKVFKGGRYEKGDLCLVKILVDEDARLYGNADLGEYFKETIVTLSPRQLVEVIPYKKTPLGYKVLIDGEFSGMIYHNEIFDTVTAGESYQGTVKTVREDGLVDVLLKKIGKEAIDDDVEKIKLALQKSGGRLSLTDKSSPEEIKSALGISKKAFKKAAGSLYRQKIISLNEDNIALIED